jgi:hypothetical protein
MYNKLKVTVSNGDLSYGGDETSGSKTITILEQLKYSDVNQSELINTLPRSQSSG